jgi:hypothetical protein
MRATYTSIELGLGLGMGMGTHMSSRVLSHHPTLALTTPLERLGLAFHSLDGLAGARRATRAVTTMSATTLVAITTMTILSVKLRTLSLPVAWLLAMITNTSLYTTGRKTHSA